MGWRGTKQKTDEKTFEKILKSAESAAGEVDDTARDEQSELFSSREGYRHKFTMHRLLERVAWSEAIQRRLFAKRIFSFIICWLSVVVLIVLLSGTNWWLFSLFNWPNEVILTLIGSTTFNVLALFVIVLKYVYRKSALEIYSDTISKESPG